MALVEENKLKGQPPKMKPNDKEQDKPDPKPDAPEHPEGPPIKPRGDIDNPGKNPPPPPPPPGGGD